MATLSPLEKKVKPVPFLWGLTFSRSRGFSSMDVQGHSCDGAWLSSFNLKEALTGSTLERVHQTGFGENNVKQR